jgi:hypothetical protein
VADREEVVRHRHVRRWIVGAAVVACASVMGALLATRHEGPWRVAGSTIWRPGRTVTPRLTGFAGNGDVYVGVAQTQLVIFDVTTNSVRAIPFERFTQFAYTAETPSRFLADGVVNATARGFVVVVSMYEYGAGTFVWDSLYSPDGLTWTELGEVSTSAVSATIDGQLSLLDNDEIAVVSKGGDRWEQRPAPWPHSFAPGSAAEVSGRTVVAGSTVGRAADGTETSVHTLWVRVNGTWSETAAPGGAANNGSAGVVSVGSSFVYFGSASAWFRGSTDRDPHYRMWRSDDGLLWSPEPIPVVAEGWHVIDGAPELVTAPKTVVLKLETMRPLPAACRQVTCSYSTFHRDIYYQIGGDGVVEVDAGSLADPRALTYLSKSNAGRAIAVRVKDGKITLWKCATQPTQDSLCPES